MKNEKGITTTANSKTMNAVENVKLFAAAGESDPVINFNDVDIVAGKAALAGGKHRKKSEVRKK